MHSTATIRKVIEATARRLGCTEHQMFLAHARFSGVKDPDIVGDGNYALFCEDCLDDDSIIDDFCLDVLCNRTVRIKELA